MEGTQETLSKSNYIDEHRHRSTNEYSVTDTVLQRKEKLHKQLSEQQMYWLLKRAVKEEVLHDAYSIEDIEQNLENLLISSPFATRLSNRVFLMHEAASRKLEARSICKLDGNNWVPGFHKLGDVDEPLEIVSAARKQWDTRLRYQLRSIAAQSNKALVRKRKETDPQTEIDLENKASSGSRFVFSSDDLYDAIAAIVNPNASSNFSRFCGWGVVKVELKTADLSALRTKYMNLRPDVRHVGVDDVLLEVDWFRDQQLREGEMLLQSGCEEGTINRLRQFAQTGVPAALRPRFWCKMLGIWPGEKDLTYFESLINSAREWEMITDELYQSEVLETADDASFFVFEEMLHEIMLAFSRDSWIPENCPMVINTAPLSTSMFGSIPTTPQSALEGIYPGEWTIPPCQVIPFNHQVQLAAPFCYLFKRPENAYFLFRQVYVRYFARLHIISSRSDTILYLCRMFEDLAQAHDPQAFYHSVELGVPPLRVAFPWLFTAFSGHLTVDQVLLLWDRLLAYDSLELLPILAAAIFHYRSQSILSAVTPEEVVDVFRDLSHIRVLPILQQFIF